ncbi:MAG: penicillin-binding transpeptidase domain-containing protein [Candidatus Levyibacteriota bacterium]
MRRKRTKIGIAFSDYVEEQTFKFSKHSHNYHASPSNLFLIVPVLVLLGAFSILLLRLFYVQVVQGAYYKTLAEQNRTRAVIVTAPRGIIFDRMGRPLVRNAPVFETIENGKASLITKEEALDLLNKGKSVTATVARDYLYKGVFAHVLGYTGQISDEEIHQPDYNGYVISDFVGKMGLEKEYEKYLHGKNGIQLYEVNAAGKNMRFLGKMDEVPGANIDTTLDVDVQEAAAKALDSATKGAVVVSDPRDGGILALYSKPTFDANLFTHAKNYTPDGDYKDISSILTDYTNQPLLDRTIGGAYPPGSTFKLVTAAAALSTGAIKPDTTFEDTGVLKVGSFSFGNWYYLQYGGKEGSVDVVKAIKRSNDIFFYHAADLAGVDSISNWARRLGAGKLTGIDLPGEVAGTVPTEEWKKKEIGEQWYTGDTYNYGIGQGYLLTTPLQVNSWTTVFANGGTLYKPHLLKNQVEKLGENMVKKDYIDLIRTGMGESCDTGGVAWPLFNFKVKNPRLKIDNINYFEDSSSSGKMTRVKLGCKTGTAEIGGKDTKPHAWITVFAPFYNPEIVVTVLVENGGEGSSVAGPVARDILTAFFEKK